LAEQAVDQLAKSLSIDVPGWTADVPLPGGDLGVASFDAFVAAQRQRYPWLPLPLLTRYARSYGSRMAALIGEATDIAGLGEAVLPGLYEAELRYLMNVEWARCADDVLWRRSKLQLHLPESAAATLDAWMAAQNGRGSRSVGNGPAALFEPRHVA
jgi:glycerol-3-phosphate dehydrogenase